MENSQFHLNFLYEKNKGRVGKKKKRESRAKESSLPTRCQWESQILEYGSVGFCNLMEIRSCHWPYFKDRDDDDDDDDSQL